VITSARELLVVLARRELLARLRDRTFLVATVVLLVLVAASVTVPLLLSRSGTSGLGCGPAGAPGGDVLPPSSKDTSLAIGGSLAFSMVFLLASFLFGMSIAQSVVEEKQSRIVEILVAAIPVRMLLAGKVLGNSVLALGQIVLFVAVGLAGANLAGQSQIVRVLLGSSGWFLLFFVLGFAMLACLWAAAGSLAGRQEDLQATTAPLQLLLFVPFVAATYVSTPGAQLTAMSYVPFTAPIAMPRRLLLHDAAGWEAVLAAAGLVVTAVALVALATRIYERSVLAPAGRIGWAAALGKGRRVEMDPAAQGV
jgi:ABC-2 type transport system permease protein